MDEKTDYIPNSNKYKSELASTSERKPVRQVASGKMAKKHALKITDVFTGGDISAIMSHLWMDVAVPALQRLILDSINDSANMLIYGERGSRRSGSPTSRISYSSLYDRPYRNEPVRSGGPSVYDYESIIVPTRAAANEVLDQMQEIIDTYGLVKVSDLFEMTNTTGPYTANRYGWVDIRGAQAVRVRDGWSFDLPKAKPIN